MQNKILLIIVIILSLINLLISSSNTTYFYTEPNIKVKDNNKAEVTTMNLEEYIVGVVAAEMPASFNIEALKAQAIASRTYATYKMQNANGNYDVVTDVSNQSFISVEEMKIKWKESFNKYYEKIKSAVYDTKGMVMLYDKKIIEAYYFAMSNGYTEDVEFVFSEDRDYLVSVESNYENNSIKNFEVSTEFSKEDICKKLNVSCEALNFSNIKRSDTNRVISLLVNNKEFKGTDFRKKLNLRSTDFTVEEKDNKILITTKGYGHGVGMSQYGANGMATEGYNYEEILKHYYKNVEISSI